MTEQGAVSNRRVVRCKRYSATNKNLTCLQVIASRNAVAADSRSRLIVSRDVATAHIWASQPAQPGKVVSSRINNRPKEVDSGPYGVIFALYPLPFLSSGLIAYLL